MSRLRVLVNIGLAIALLTAGLPVFTFEDASRDGQVDLADAVLTVREVVEAAQAPGDFHLSFNRAISALEATAGLKTVIRTETQVHFQPAQLQLAGFFLLSTPPQPHSAPSAFVRPDPPIHFRSFQRGPSTPPPEWA